MKLTARLYEAGPPGVGGLPHPPLCHRSGGRLPAGGEVSLFPAPGLPVLVGVRPGIRLGGGEGEHAGADALLCGQCDPDPGRGDGYPPRLHGTVGYYRGPGGCGAARLPNRSYTSYMLAAAHAGGPLEILAAILACSWSYAEIAGQLLAQNPAAIDHPLYGEWVAGYTSEDYVRTNAALMDRLDALTEGCPPEQAAGWRISLWRAAGMRRSSGIWPGPGRNERCCALNTCPTAIPRRTLTSSTI